MTDEREVEVDNEGDVQDETSLPAASHEALALEFAREYGSILKIAHHLGWGRYDGKKWDFADSKFAAGRLLRTFLREEAVKLNDPQKARQLCSWSTHKAVECLLQRDSGRLLVAADIWDQNKWLLNTPTGTVDLRDGEVYEHSSDDYITKITKVGPKRQAYPLWLKFLDQITNGDKTLQAYLQCMAGYMLTGDTREHALFFCYGTGGNGKSVFIETLVGILADYAVTTSINTFTRSKYDRHPTEIAQLRGARLVTAVETEEGKPWDETKIKAMTGGDYTSARFMKGDFFQFKPQLKLLIAGNHKPAIRSVDEAMRRRLHLIPFEITIPPSERDPLLQQKLKREWPGILQWMIEGCLHWRESGLNPPAAVKRATLEYLQAEDVVGRFLDERCEIRDGMKESSAELYAAWTKWATEFGEYPGSNKSFSQKLEDRGFVKKREARGVYFERLALTI